MGDGPPSMSQTLHEGLAFPDTRLAATVERWE